MKYEILVALFRERFDFSTGDYYTTIGDMVNRFWVPLAFPNKEKSARRSAAVDGELNLAHQYYSY